MSHAVPNAPIAFVPFVLRILTGIGLIYAAWRDRGIKPAGVDDPDVFMVRAVSLSLPESASWADCGREHMRAQLGADFGYRL